MFFIILFILIVISFLLAIRSMKDFQIPVEISQYIKNKKIKGTIVVLKNKTVHYKAKRQ